MLQDEINKLIQENLPQALGQELTKELKRLYEIQKKHEHLEVVVKEYAEDTVKLQKQIESLKASVQLQNEIEQREKQLNEDIMKLDLELTRERLGMREEELKRHDDYVRLLLRNPVIKDTVWKSDSSVRTSYDTQTGMEVAIGQDTIHNQVTETRETE